MSEVVLYIDDEKTARVVFSEVIEQLYNDEYPVECPKPETGLSEMISVISSYQGVVSIIIDEKLKVSGKTEYQGSELAAELRAIFEILPIYILTSEPALLEPMCGSVEYVLNKNNLEQPDYRIQCESLLRRHVANTKAIISEKKSRFDALLRKSLESTLSQEELAEFEDLELFRLKPVIATESLVSEDHLKVINENHELLDRFKIILESKDSDD